MRRAAALGAVVLAAAVSAAGLAGQQQRTIEVEQLEDNLFVLRGGGGNSAAFVTSGGVVLVDSKLAGWGQPLIDKIGELTPNPVTTIINTHAHFDHVDGNVEFPASVDFVAHENTRRLMGENNAVRGLGRPARPSPFGAGGHGLPETTFSDRLTLGRGDDRVELRYFGRAHTGGDAWVVFPALGVMHAGDAFPGKNLPIMDSNNGGSGVDYPETLRRASEGTAGVVERIITGHSSVMTPADLAEYAEFVGAFVAAAQTAKAAGTPAADFVAGWEAPARFAGYGGAPPERLTPYVEDIYAATP